MPTLGLTSDQRLAQCQAARGVRSPVPADAAAPCAPQVWIVANTRIGRALMAKWCATYSEGAARYWRRDPAGRHTGQDDLSWKCMQPDETRPGRRVACQPLSLPLSLFSLWILF